MSPAMTWVILVVLFAVLEMVTAALVSIWFVIGAIGAAITAAFGAETWIQVLVFIAISVAVLVLTKPIVSKIRKRPPEELNANRIIGEKGIITQNVDIVLGTGEVKIGGVVWTCRSVDQSVIKSDSIVEIVRIEGVKAIVKKI